MSAIRATWTIRLGIIGAVVTAAVRLAQVVAANKRIEDYCEALAALALGRM